MLIIMLLCPLLLTGCGMDGGRAEQKKTAHLVLYSELEHGFTEELVRAYNENGGGGAALSVIYELTADTRPDLVLAERRTLNGLRLDGRLQAFSCLAAEVLPPAFKDGENFWYGAFYDPVVFLVNQGFSRTVGQERIHGWAELEDGMGGARVVMENLSNNNSTGNLLGALADRMGETQSLNYLWNVNRFVTHYSKFPFTPIRMTAVGDADLAVTRNSLVYKYLESNFPAYVVYPEEGAPVDLYGVAVFKEARAAEACGAFTAWLLQDAEAQRVSQMQNTGFFFLLPQGGRAAEPDKLWLNNSYLLYGPQEELKRKWLEKVRFSGE